MDKDAAPTMRLDSTAVRVLAHPLRSRLLTALRRNGPATATELAGRLATNTGATSYHLRKLESVGLVVDSGGGAGRRRPWAASTRSHSWVASDFAGDEGASAASVWLGQHYFSEFAEQYAAWLAEESSWPADWRDASSHDDDVVTVTPAQLERMRAEIFAILQRYRTAGAEAEDARTVRVHLVAYPKADQNVKP